MSAGKNMWVKRKHMGKEKPYGCREKHISTQKNSNKTAIK